MNQELVDKLKKERAELIKSKPHLKSLQDQLDRMMARLPDPTSRLVLLQSLLEEKREQLLKATKEIHTILEKALKDIKK